MKEDIPDLLGAFLRDAAIENGTPLKRISGDAMLRLLAYDWPGNVREMKNYVECLSFTVEGNEILEEHLPPEILHGGSRPDECAAISAQSQNFESLERAFLVETIRKLGGNAVEAARTLGVSRSTLYRKLKKHGISC